MSDHDIVEYLRAGHNTQFNCLKAANEIERLRDVAEQREARLIDALAARQRMEQQAAQSNVDWLAVRGRLAEAEAARSITRATLTDARRFVVMNCGDSSPTAKIMLERIDKALAESEVKTAANAAIQEPDYAK